jgi:hypothetical protein
MTTMRTDHALTLADWQVRAACPGIEDRKYWFWVPLPEVKPPTSDEHAGGGSEHGQQQP